LRGVVQEDILNDVIHMSRHEREVVLGDFEQLVLLALVRLGPEAYGATIRREIEQRTGRRLSIGAVYVTLRRLEFKGFVVSRIGEPTPERGGRRRKHIALLPAGRRAVAQAYRAFTMMADGLEHQFRRP
jgi:PadR family transcriptional regulator PadR